MKRWILLVLLIGFLLVSACVSVPVQSSSLVGCWKTVLNTSPKGGISSEVIYRFDAGGAGRYYALFGPGNPTQSFPLDWQEIASTDRIRVRVYLENTSEPENVEFTYDAGNDTLCTGGGFPYCNFSRILCAGITQ